MICTETRIFSKVLELLCSWKDDVIIYWNDDNKAVISLKGHEAEVTINFEDCGYFQFECRERENSDIDKVIDVAFDATDDNIREHLEEVFAYITEVNA